MSGTYNGHANYETWAVKLWMDNEYSLYQYWLERTREIGEGLPPSTLTVSHLAEELKDWHEENAPDLGATVWADLLGAALCEVDWRDIAESLLEDNADTERECNECGQTIPIAELDDNGTCAPCLASMDKDGNTPESIVAAMDSLPITEARD